MRIGEILRTIAAAMDQAEGADQVSAPADAVGILPVGQVAIEPAHNVDAAEEPDINNKSVVPSNELPDEEQDIVNLIKQLSGMPADCNS